MHDKKRSALCGCRVFVAEDETLIALDLAAFLESAGYEVLGPYARVSQALEVATTSEFELAVLDVDLAGHEIWPVAELLQRRGIPFLFLTGYGALAEFRPHLRHATVLEKPFVPRDLLDRLIDLRSGGRASLASQSLVDQDHARELAMRN